MENQRNYDVVIWGATGYTGKLVATYLHKQYGVDSALKWAMAGRNQEKLNAVVGALGDAAIPTIVADSFDEDSLKRMAAQTKVICSTVGPYLKYGALLVKVCAENGTHYCDLTGEVPWMRKMIDQHHETAVANRTKIVHACGYDSIPSDYGVLFLQQKAKEACGQYCEHIKLRVRAAKGGFSGGTYDSMRNMLQSSLKDPSIPKIFANPYALNPDPNYKGKDTRDLNKTLLDEDVGYWIAPFIMGVINTRVVRRSHALAGFPYGGNFRYDEAIITGNGLNGWIWGKLIHFVTNLIRGAKPGSFFRYILDWIFPKPGQGPTPEQRENGFFKMMLWGKTKDGQSLRGIVTGDKDPGYGSTSKMLGEAAVCLAMDQDKTPDNFGVITPTHAMGMPLLSRLQNSAGLKFELQE